MKRLLKTVGTVTFVIFSMVGYGYAICEGDINCNGVTDGADLALFAADFGTTGCGTCDDVISRVETLEAEVAALKALLAGVTRSTDPQEPETIQFSGVNVQIVNGLNNTETANDLGNLIVGYNELRGAGDIRSGSHNIVVGSQNNHSSYGGLVTGFSNTISGSYSSVNGGYSNRAAGEGSSVSGGHSNLASGDYSSVGGGYSNIASGEESSVSAGFDNIASGLSSSVSAGFGNTASGNYSSVSAGINNTASGVQSSVSGGSRNTASGRYSSVSAGVENSADGQYSSISGGAYNQSNADATSVSGGHTRGVWSDDPYGWRAGGLYQDQ